MRAASGLLCGVFCLALGSSAVAGGIWEAYPKLVCHGVRQHACTAADLKCADASSPIRMPFDFAAGTVKVAGADQPRVIVHRYFDPGITGVTHAQNTINLEDGEEIAFLGLDPNPAGKSEIPAVFMGTIDTQFFVSTLSCHPA